MSPRPIHRIPPMIRRLCIAALLLVGAPAALAAQDTQDAHPSCDDARTQLEMNECAGRTFQMQDSVLNRVYPRVVAALDSARVPLLREAQRQWIRVRDADCALETAELQGGSMAPMVHAFCLAYATQERIRYLRGFLPEPDDEAEARRAVIDATEALFAAMQEKDTTTLRRLIHPRAQIVAVSDDAVGVRTLDEWIPGLTRSPDALVERMWNPRVEIDGNLATLWAPYDFHLGERFSHCGYDAFQFVREGGAWKMIAITFTRRTTGCDAP